jgi:hypothetical protein
MFALSNTMFVALPSKDAITFKRKFSTMVARFEAEQVLPGVYLSGKFNGRRMCWKMINRGVYQQDVCVLRIEFTPSEYYTYLVPVDKAFFRRMYGYANPTFPTAADVPDLHYERYWDMFDPKPCNRCDLRYDTY